MKRRTSTPRSEILARLLEIHERSVSFRKAAPWPRDAILKVDARTFPEAFAADGREARAGLLVAIGELAAEGRVRVVRHGRGPLLGEAKEVRVGPEQVERAYDAAVALGFEPVAVGLDVVERHATSLAGGCVVPWMREYLEAACEGVRRADPGVLGMSRERFKAEWREVVPALTVAAGLAGGIAPAWERVVSERLLGDSKLLGRVRGTVVGLLARADPRWAGVPPEEAGDLLEAYGVRRKPGLIRCAGSARLRVGDAVYRMEDFEPVAHLPDGWAGPWVEGLLSAGVRQVTSIENEYPFLSYVEESGGPAGLGARGEVAVYTAGFPTPSLVDALTRLAEGGGEAISFRHWGDADVGGIRIWWFLRSRLGRPVDLFRTTAEWVAAESARGGGRQLSAAERRALERLGMELEREEGTDVGAVRELIGAMLEVGVKIEQERY